MRMTVEQWQAVDWSKDNRQLAQELGKTYDTVAKKRWMLKAGKSDQRATRKDKGVSKTTYVPSAEQQIKATAAAKASELGGRGESNAHAKSWVLVSPSDNVYHVKNLHHFVRTNAHLFDAADAKWRRTGGKRGTGGEYCNATAGLSNVRQGKSSAWKGWRLK